MFVQQGTFTLFVLCLLIVANQAASGCANGFMQLDLLRRRAEKIPTDQMSTNMLNDEFRLVPELNFTCSGTIISLLLGVDVRTVTGNRNQYPEVHIWRRSSANTYHSLQDRQQITLDTGNFSPDGVLQYNLTSPLQFQSGDVLGVYQPQDGNSVVRLYYSVNDSAPDAILITNADPSTLSSITTVSGAFNTVDDQYILLSPITDPPCTNGFLSPRDLRQQTVDMNINRVRRRDQQQRLFPGIHFTCNGSITKWIVGANMSGSGTEQPELQIWRRDSGGGNSFTKLNFSLLTPNETSDPNVHEYYPDTPLQFQEGDILGVYTPDNGDSQLVVYYQENTDPDNYRQNNVDPPAPSTFTLGDPISQNDYPLVTLEISTVSLPSSTISITKGTDMRLPLVTQFTSISSLPTHLPDPSTGNAVTIIATVVSVVVVLIIIVVVCIVLMAVLIWLKWSHHKHMELQDNVCYSTSSRNVIENQPEQVNISQVPDAKHTDPPIDVDQNVAYHKHIELHDNVCYTTSSRNEDGSDHNAYAHIPVDLQHTIPAQAPAMMPKMVENVAYGAVLTTNM